MEIIAAMQDDNFVVKMNRREIAIFTGQGSTGEFLDESAFAVGKKYNIAKRHENLLHLASIPAKLQKLHEMMYEMDHVLTKAEELAKATVFTAIGKDKVDVPKNVYQVKSIFE